MSDRTDDHVAIRRLLDAYADVVCRREWDDLAALFDPDVTIAIAKAGGDLIEISGPTEFAAFVGPAMEPYEFFVFQILNARIEFESDDRATSRMFMTEIRQAHGDFSQVYGRYDDTFTRRDGRWWFTDRRYRTLARTATAAGRLDVF